MPEVFVGIPTINRPLLVRETIDSVLAQTFHDIRVIVSDNRSDGEGTRLVREYVEGLGDDRVSFYLQPENLGEYGQGYYFMDQAVDCPYFMILHDDDVLKETYIETGVGRLRECPDVALFVANPFIMDEHSIVSAIGTDEYLLKHHRSGVSQGVFDVLDMHLKYGFTPISGTLFHRSSLQESGYLDKDGYGNALFECDVFLNLGDIGARGWFEAEELLGFRFHQASMRNYMNLMDNPDYVEELMRLLSRRTYSGTNETQRRKILNRLYRAAALISLRQGNTADSRKNIMQAFQEYLWSPMSWLIAGPLLLLPTLMKSLLPDLPTIAQRPVLQDHE